MAALLLLCFGFVIAGCADSPRERREERRDDRHDERVENHSDWEKLGERMVNHKAGVDHDTIMVTGSEGTFTRVRLKCDHSALELFDVKITFGA
jgi:hypothetical protein